MTDPTGFQLRSPWYARERGGFGLRDAPSLRPHIQAYAGSDFAERILADPTVYLKPTPEDRWGYPVPVNPFGKGRSRLSAYQLVRTDMRKLFQPSHDRFYAVVVEVFCDRSGLPRAGGHDDLEAGFVMRRRHVSYNKLTIDDTGKKVNESVRTLATKLMKDMAAVQVGHPVESESATADSDIRELWWSADAASRFAEENKELIDKVHPTNSQQAWVTTDAGSSWSDSDRKGPMPGEQVFPMWKLPPRDGDCATAQSRSLWFGIVPTFSSDHGVAGTVGQQRLEPKLDEHGIYELVCFVKQKPRRGHEHCPPKIWFGASTEPFRLASPMDPDGTKNRTVSITLPDFRALEARAGQPMGPGGVRIVTPPQSQMVFNPFGDKVTKKGAIGPGGGVCMFAIELFFIVAFFLFLMFMPIVVLAFQLWWMLALRFCIPPSISFSALADASASGKLEVNAAEGVSARARLDAAFGAGILVDVGDADGNVTNEISGEPWFSALKEAIPGTDQAAKDKRAEHAETLTLAGDPVLADPRTLPVSLQSRKDPLCL